MQMRFVADVKLDQDRTARVYGKAAREVLESALLDSVRYVEGVQRAQLVAAHQREAGQ